MMIRFIVNFVVVDRLFAEVNFRTVGCREGCGKKIRNWVVRSKTSHMKYSFA